MRIGVFHGKMVFDSYTSLIISIGGIAVSDIIKTLSPKYEKLIRDINRQDYSSYTPNQLKDAALKLREEISAYQANPSAIPYTQHPDFISKAFALVKTSVFLCLNLRAYDEQLWAGLILNDRAIVEMATGEGKTIAAVFAAFFNSLDNKKVHVYTFNDYLAKRDAVMMSPVYQMLGVRVGYLYEGQDLSERKNAYACNITYMTAKECGFDYLREFLVESSDELLLPEPYYAIIDEADSILIDEARIPLVIASSTEESHNIDLFKISDCVNHLRISDDYEIDEYSSNIYLTEEGISRVEDLLEIDNLYDEYHMHTIVSVNNALFAKELVHRDIDYIVRNQQIELVDEFTGRVARKRHWPHGLHEAIEAKEQITPSRKGQIQSQITLQNFIRRYPHLSGMTGTATSAVKEFLNTYNLRVHIVPTHHPMIRTDHEDRLFRDKASKFDAILDEIWEAHQIGRPVLVGTCSVEESENLSRMLESRGLTCEVLNAKNDAKEATQIAVAGKSYAITVSTNMAGRGIDIKLGAGDPADKKFAIETGGLLVIGTNRHESLRIDRQLRGRSGRQGDPGDSKFLISLEDELFVKYNFSELISERWINNISSAVITHPKILKEASRLQKIAEGLNYDIRDSLSKYTVMIQEQSEYIRSMRFSILVKDLHESIYFQRHYPDKYCSLCEKFSPERIHHIEKIISLRVVNQSWADYLDNMSYIKDSIHIMKMSGMDPLFEYNKILFESFNELKRNIDDQIVHLLGDLEITEDETDFSKLGLPKPASTWTYIVSNTAEQLNLFPFLESLTKIAKKRWFE
jgi:preprotein translocase subunit SecA